MTKIIVHNRKFEVLDKEELISILDNLDYYDLKEKIEEMYWEVWRNNNITLYDYAYVYLDARDGSLNIAIAEKNSQLHPWDSYYRIILAHVDFPIDIPDEELVDLTDPEDDKLLEEAKDRDVSVMTVLEEMGLLEERLTNYFDFYANETTLKIFYDRFTRKFIFDQIEELYKNAIVE